MKKINIYFILFCFTYSLSFAQIEFSLNQDLLSDLDVKSGAPMAVSDMNGDGLDDIVSLDKTRDLVISFQNFDRSFDVVDYPTVGSSNWGMTIGDIDNDGRCEIFTGGAYDRIRLVSFEDDGTIQTEFMDGPSIFVQAVSFFDMDNNGSLDAFACHDDGPNGVYLNDGNGTLSHIGAELPFEKFSGDENNSGNYGNVWSDVNGDGLMDYYIAKCRQGVTDVTDKRRINQLWINNGDGSFNESAEEFGLDIGLQSWTTEFQDIDNDGDMDCLITNHDGPTQLFENIDNTGFENITSASGISTTGLPIQAVMRDFDNDGFVDVFITGNGGRLFRNNGDKTFTLIPESVSNFEGDETSFACGDLNHDGFVDIMIGYGTGFNSPSSRSDKLWINNTNSNNWLAVQLEGDQSNKGGVGSRIELYGSWGMMVREVRAGESYGISHSLTQHFGIGSTTAIDSIVVRWPSGIIDRYEDVGPNQFIRVKENSCITPSSAIVANGPTTFCSGDEVTLSADLGYDYIWSNGQTTSSITVASSGVYNVQISDGSDCSTFSTSIEVIVDPEESFEIIPSGDLVICENESIVFDNSLMTNVSWSDGSVGSSIEVSQSGSISATGQGTCGEISSNVLNLEVLPTPNDPTDLSYEYELDQVTLTAQGESISWHDEDLDLLGNGNEFTLTGGPSQFRVYALNSTDNSGNITSGGEESHTGSSDFNSDGFNGGMIFNVSEEVTLHEVTVETDMEGIRTFVLRDNSGVELEEVSVDLPKGKSTIKLDFNIEPGNGYNLTTDTQQNFETLGTESPRLKRSSVDFGSILYFPYPVGDYLEIQTTNFGNNFYYYFYDWKVSLASKICVSDYVPLDILPSSTLNINQNTDITLSPNPSAGLFNLAYQGSEAFDIRVLSLNGNELLDAKDLRATHTIDISTYSAGIYILEMKVEGDTYFSKMIKL